MRNVSKISSMEPYVPYSTCIAANMKFSGFFIQNKVQNASNSTFKKICSVNNYIT